MLSFWTTLTAGIIMLCGFFVPGGHAAAGWTSYAPLSAVVEYTGVNWGQNLWCISLFIMGIGSMMGSINYITTVINMRAPGMTMFRMPLVIWSLFITAILLLLALPVLTSGVAMLLFDRWLGTSWFRPSGGGEPLLWQHLFWYFGHPEVYILILPAMGIASEILPVFSRKPIFGYHAMAFSMISIAFLSWIVWGHHMFVSGMNPALGMSFMVTTMVIAVPSAIKTFNWLGTLWGGRIQLHGADAERARLRVHVRDRRPLRHLHGLDARRHLHPGHLLHRRPHPLRGLRRLDLRRLRRHLLLVPEDVRPHDEPRARLSALRGRRSSSSTCTFFPMHIIGVGGHMRRIYNPMQYEFLQHQQHWNVIITIGAFGLAISQIPFIINFFWSLFAGPKAPMNPWNANTLEWTAPSPPPHLNWGAKLPTVYRGPYEYSVPGASEDYSPQTQPGPVPAGARRH